MKEITFAQELEAISDKALEDLENMATIYDLETMHDLVLAEMRRRPDFVPSSYSLMYELQG